MLARFAGIDRTALGFWSDRLHCPCAPSPSDGCPRAALALGRPVATARRDLLLAVWAGVRPLGDRGGASAASGEIVLSLSIPRPKKRGPFQFVPVMARAMVERLAWVASRQTKPFAITVTVCRSPWYSRTSRVPGLRRFGRSTRDLSPRAR